MGEGKVRLLDHNVFTARIPMHKIQPVARRHLSYASNSHEHLPIFAEFTEPCYPPVPGLIVLGSEYGSSTRTVNATSAMNIELHADAAAATAAHERYT